MAVCITCQKDSPRTIKYIDDDEEIVDMCPGCYAGLLAFIGTDDEEE